MRKQIKIALCTISISGFSFAQIPNNSFENWVSTNGYQTPSEWSSLNEMTKKYSAFTCGKATGNSGNTYLILTTVSVTGKGLIPGRIVSGKIDTTNYKALSGYPFTSRPDNMSCSMQYMVASPNDTAFISVLLTKWNEAFLKRDTIAYGISSFNGMAHEWFTSSTSLSYKSTGKPDSACIVLSSSGIAALNKSYMYIDNLQFNDSAININTSSAVIDNVIFYPNPSADYITINTNQQINGLTKVNIYNNLGMLVFEKIITEDKMSVNVSAWPKGQYTVELKQNSRMMKKLIVK